jgi:hypothetical protein
MIREQNAARFDRNYLIAKEFAGVPRVTHDATARGAEDTVSYKSFATKYRASVLYTTVTLDRTLNILPRHSIPPSSGL